MNNTVKILSLFIIQFSLTSLLLHSQSHYEYFENDVKLKAGFETESVNFNDTILLHIEISNQSNCIFQIFPMGKLCIKHKNEYAFVFHDTPERISYFLNDIAHLEKRILLHPMDTCNLFINVIIREDFFYIGKNSLFIVYRANDKNNLLLKISNDFNLFIE